MEIGPSAVREVFRALVPGTLAVRPPVQYDLEGAHPFMHSPPDAAPPSLGPSGPLGRRCVCALRAGHGRTDEFPDLTADDLFIDRLFKPRRRPF